MLPIQKLFSANQWIFEINFEGITHEDSLKEMYNCNSANWILGHLVYTRNALLASIDNPPIAGEEMKEVYARGVVRPDMSKAVELDVLKKKYVDSQPAIMKGVEQVKDENLLEQLTIFGFHEAYHLGQIGLIRKLLGKEGAIK